MKVFVVKPDRTETDIHRQVSSWTTPASLLPGMIDAAGDLSGDYSFPAYLGHGVRSSQAE